MDPSDSSHGTPFRPRNGNGTGNHISTSLGNALPGSHRTSSGSAMLRASPYSPFPFGLPIQSSSRSLLSPGSIDQQEAIRNDEIERKDQFPTDNVNHSGLHVLRGRVRAQDVYGGPVMFGGAPSYSTSSARISNSMKTRNQRLLLSASPYHCAAASRIASKQQGRQRPSHSSSTTPSPSGSSTASSVPGGVPTNPSQPAHGAGLSRPMNNSPAHHLHNSPHHPIDPNSSNSSNYSRPSSSLASASAKSGTIQSTDASGLSSTARLILDTLDKMSTPIRDAQRMSTVLSNNSLQHEHVNSSTLGTKVSRAERRRMIAEALDASSVSMNLSNSSLSMQDDLIFTPYDKNARAKRRRPQLGAPSNGNISNNRSLAGKDNYFNGPPLRSLAFSPVVKDKGAAQVPLKSARIQNIEESTLNQHKRSPLSFATTNANNLTSLAQSKTSEKVADVKFSSISKDGYLPRSSHNVVANSDSNNDHKYLNPVIGNSFADKSTVLMDTLQTSSALPTKQGGKIKTKISTGLEQVRAQRGGKNMIGDENLEYSKDEYQLKNTKSLSTFLNPVNNLSDKTFESIKPFPDINFSSSSSVKPSLNVGQLDTLSQAPLVSKSSREIISKNQDILTRKAGAYETYGTSSSHTSTITASESKASTISSNSLTFPTPQSTAETSVSHGGSVLPSSPFIEKKFTFSSVVELRSTTKQNHTESDHPTASFRTFTFSEPTSAGNINSIINKVSVGLKSLRATQDGQQSSFIRSTKESMGQDGPLPDLTKIASNIVDNKLNPTFNSNGCSIMNRNRQAHENAYEYASNPGSSRLNVPDLSSSVMMTPAYGSEIGGSSMVPTRFISTENSNHSLLRQNPVPNSFSNATSQSIMASNSMVNLTSAGIPKIGQLRSGSVMDILKGTPTPPTKTSPLTKQNDLQSTSAWDPKFKQSDKPWNLS